MLTTLTVDLTNSLQCQDVIYTILEHRGLDALSDIVAAMRKRSEEQRLFHRFDAEVCRGVASNIEAWIESWQRALCP